MPKRHSSSLKKKLSLVRKTKLLALAGVALGSFQAKAMNSGGDQGGAGYASSARAASPKQQAVDFTLNAEEVAKNIHYRNASVDPNKFENAKTQKWDFNNFKFYTGWFNDLHEKVPNSYHTTHLEITGDLQQAQDAGKITGQLCFLAGSHFPELKDLKINIPGASSALIDGRSLKNFSALESLKVDGQNLSHLLPKNASHGATASGGASAYSSDSDEDEDDQGGAVSAVPAGHVQTAFGFAKANHICKFTFPINHILDGPFKDQLMQKKGELSGAKEVRIDMNNPKKVDERSGFSSVIIEMLPPGIEDLSVQNMNFNLYPGDTSSVEFMKVRKAHSSTLKGLEFKDSTLNEDTLYTISFNPKQSDPTYPQGFSLKEFSCSGCTLPLKGAEYIGEIPVKQPIEELKLRNCGLTDVDMKKMADTAETTKDVIENINAGHGYSTSKYLTKNSDLKVLDLSGNSGITSQSIDDIARFLNITTGFKKKVSICLKGTGIQKTDEAKIKQALSNHKKLNLIF